MNLLKDISVSPLALFLSIKKLEYI